MMYYSAPVIVKTALSVDAIRRALDSRAVAINTLKNKKAAAALAYKTRMQVLNMKLHKILGRDELRAHPAFDPDMVGARTLRSVPRPKTGEGVVPGVYELGSVPDRLRRPSSAFPNATDASPLWGVHNGVSLKQLGGKPASGSVHNAPYPLAGIVEKALRERFPR